MLAARPVAAQINDAFVPLADEAAAALAKGATLDDLKRALDAPGGLVPLGEHGALAIDVAEAVRRRLQELDREEWTARMPSGAPGTPGAARAELAAADRALERGAFETARAWLHALADEPALADARARRLAWLAERKERGAAPPAATRLGLVARHALDDPESRRTAARFVAPGKGQRPGLALLDDGRVAVQSASLVTLFTRGAAGFAPSHRIDLLASVDEHFINTSLPFAAPGAPGWPLEPAAQGARLVAVQGRMRLPEEPNALVAIDLPRAAAWRPRADAAPLMAERTPLAWARAGDRRLVDGRPVADPALVELAQAEFQAGPVIVDDLVVVQARTYGGAVEAWLAAFRLEDGAVVWLRRLARGSDRVDNQSRFAETARLASGALTVHDGLVLVPTHLGTLSLVRAADGRVLWTARVPRRGVDAAGGDGGRPLVVDGEALWAPSDAEQRFRFDFPWPSADAGFVGTPLDGDFALIGAAPSGVWTLGRSGRSQTVRWRGPTGRVDALHLDPAEEFRGRPALTPNRLVAATDRGLYLFDLERELYLLDFEPFAERSGSGRSAGGTAGGDVHVTDGDVLCLERDALVHARLESTE